MLPEQLVGTGSNNQAVVQAENQNTGSGSVSEAGVEISNSIDLENNNEADIQNNVQISSNTGNNSTNFNTGGGQVETGTTESQINIQTLANQAIISGGNLFYFLINVLGTWTGANLLSSTSSTLDSTADLSVGNENTGLNSTNTANIKSTDDLKITNNNQASLENNLNLSANTGNNQASYNTGNGIIKTGNTNIIASILNFVNLSLVTDKAIFLVVNVFGDWNGNINVQETEITSSDNH